MTLDQAIEKLVFAGLFADTCRTIAEDGSSGPEFISGHVEEVWYENPKPGESIGHTLGGFDIKRKGERWVIDFEGGKKLSVQSLEDAVTTVIRDWAKGGDA